MTHFRLIGDVHQLYPQYLPLLENARYTLQVGDLGFDYRPLADLDPSRHRAIAGNHDCYQCDSPNYFARQPFFLGNHGLHTVPDLPPIFYVRGGWSIDWKWRERQQTWPVNGPVTWWPEEELSTAEIGEAIAAYRDARPAIVVSHEAPISVVGNVTHAEFVRNWGYEPGVIKTRTSLGLQAMLEAHQPKLWVFGHYHTRWDAVIDGTRFVCLDMVRPFRPGTNPERKAECYLDLTERGLG